MVRLYVPPALVRDRQATVSADDWAYLTTVLRLRPGDALEIFDGAGVRLAAKLTATPRQLELVGAPQPDLVTAGPRLSLWQGLPKGDKLEWVIQKAAELGAAEVVPLVCQRSVARLPPARAVAKLARWRKIAVEAARQCGRADLAEVGEPADIEALCALARGGAPVLVLYEALAGQGEVLGLAAQLHALRDAPRLAIAVGPEGGFDAAEVEALVAAGARLARLGRRILRTETAGLVACTLWAACVGELG